MHLTRKDTLSKKKKAAQGVAINTVAGLNERLLPRFIGNPVALDEMKQASFPQDEYIVLSILPAGKGFVLTSLRILRNVLEADIGWGDGITFKAAQSDLDARRPLTLHHRLPWMKVASPEQD